MNDHSSFTGASFRKEMAANRKIDNRNDGINIQNRRAPIVTKLRTGDGDLVVKNNDLATLMATPSLVFTERSLEHAAGNGNMEIFSYLWQMPSKITNFFAGIGIIPDITNLVTGYAGRIPLTCSEHAFEMAATNGHLEMVKYLHLLGCPCTEDAVDGAAKNGHLSVVEWLLENRRERFSINGLYSVVDNGHLAILQKMLSFYQPVKQEEATLLARAMIHNQVSVAEFLSPRDIRKDTMYYLRISVENGHMAMVKYLIAKLAGKFKLDSKLVGLLTKSNNHLLAEYFEPFDPSGMYNLKEIAIDLAIAQGLIAKAKQLYEKHNFTPFTFWEYSRSRKIPRATFDTEFPGRQVNRQNAFTIEDYKWLESIGYQFDVNEVCLTLISKLYDTFFYLLDRKTQYYLKPIVIEHVIYTFDLDLIKKFFEKTPADRRTKKILDSFNMAIYSGNLEIVKWMYSEFSPSVNDISMDHTKMLMRTTMAAQSGNMEMVRWLIEQGYPHLSLTSNYSVLIQDNLEIFEYLFVLEYVETLPLFVKTEILEMAIRHDSLNIVRWLILEKGFKFSENALDEAIYTGNLAMIQFILEHQLDFVDKGIIVAVERGYLTILQTLLQYSKYSVLELIYTAFKSGQLTIVQWLLSNNPIISLDDCDLPCFPLDGPHNNEDPPGRQGNSILKFLIRHNDISFVLWFYQNRTEGRKYRDKNNPKLPNVEAINLAEYEHYYILADRLKELRT